MPARRGRGKLNAAAFRKLAAKQAKQRDRQKLSAKESTKAGKWGPLLTSELESTQETSSCAGEDEGQELSSSSLSSLGAAQDVVLEAGFSHPIKSESLESMSLSELLEVMGRLPACERTAFVAKLCSARGFRKRSAVHNMLISGRTECWEKLLIVAAECPSILSQKDALNCGVLHYAGVEPQSAFPRCVPAVGASALSAPNRLMCLLQQFQSHLQSSINSTSKAGISPLHIAAVCLRPDSVAALCGAGADPLVACRQGIQPAGYSVLASIETDMGAVHSSGSAFSSLLDTLRQCGAHLWQPHPSVAAELKNLRSKSVTVVLNSVSSNLSEHALGEAAMHWSGCQCCSCVAESQSLQQAACTQAQPIRSKMQIALEILADHMLCTHGGIFQSPLHLACAFGSPHTVMAVLSAIHGAAEPLDAQGVSKILATYSFSDETQTVSSWERNARRLSAYGGGMASVACALLQPSLAPHGDNALLVACRMGNLSVVQFLLDAGVGVQDKTAAMQSALTAVCTGPVTAQSLAVATVSRALAQSPAGTTINHLTTTHALGGSSVKVVSAAQEDSSLLHAPSTSPEWQQVVQSDDEARAKIAELLLNAGCICNPQEQRACMESSILARRPRLLVVLAEGGFPIQALLTRQAIKPPSSADTARECVRSIGEPDDLSCPPAHVLLRHAAAPSGHSLYGIHRLRQHDAATDKFEGSTHPTSVSDSDALVRLKQHACVLPLVSGSTLAQAHGMVHDMRAAASEAAVQIALFYQALGRPASISPVCVSGASAAAVKSSLSSRRASLLQMLLAGEHIGDDHSADVSLVCDVQPSSGWREFVDIGEEQDSYGGHTPGSQPAVVISAHLSRLRAVEYIQAAHRVAQASQFAPKLEGTQLGSKSHRMSVTLRCPSATSLLCLLWLAYWNCVPDCFSLQLLLQSTLGGSESIFGFNSCFGMRMAYVLVLADAILLARLWLWDGAVEQLQAEIKYQLQFMASIEHCGGLCTGDCYSSFSEQTSGVDVKAAALFHEGAPGVHELLRHALGDDCWGDVQSATDSSRELDLKHEVFKTVCLSARCRCLQLLQDLTHSDELKCLPISSALETFCGSPIVALKTLSRPSGAIQQRVRAALESDATVATPAGQGDYIPDIRHAPEPGDFSSNFSMTTSIGVRGRNSPEYHVCASRYRPATTPSRLQSTGLLDTGAQIYLASIKNSAMQGLCARLLGVSDEGRVPAERKIRDLWALHSELLRRVQRTAEGVQDTEHIYGPNEDVEDILYVLIVLHTLRAHAPSPPSGAPPSNPACLSSSSAADTTSCEKQHVLQTLIKENQTLASQLVLSGAASLNRESVHPDATALILAHLSSGRIRASGNRAPLLSLLHIVVFALRSI